jgi:uncharacterized membrane protein
MKKAVFLMIVSFIAFITALATKPPNSYARGFNYGGNATVSWIMFFIGVISIIICLYLISKHSKAVDKQEAEQRINEQVEAMRRYDAEKEKQEKNKNLGG